jgi:predicted nucleic acid-binding protein
MDYIDTSALIKGYLIEANTPAFMRWFSEEAVPCVSPLSVVEFRCAVRRRERAGDLMSSRARAILDRFEGHLVDGTLEQLAWPASAFLFASNLIDRLAPLPLRALDALHLAVASTHGCKALASADLQQLRAARALGMTAHSFASPA